MSLSNAVILRFQPDYHFAHSPPSGTIYLNWVQEFRLAFQYGYSCSSTLIGPRLNLPVALAIIQYPCNFGLSPIRIVRQSSLFAMPMSCTFEPRLPTTRCAQYYTYFSVRTQQPGYFRQRISSAHSKSTPILIVVPRIRESCIRLCWRSKVCSNL